MADLLANGARLAAERRRKKREELAAAAAKSATPSPPAEPPSQPPRPPLPAPAPAPAPAAEEAAVDAKPPPSDEALSDAAVVAALAACSADWSAAPAKLRALLQEHGIGGVSEKCLKRLKQTFATAAIATQSLNTAGPASAAAGSSGPEATTTTTEERAGRGRCAVAAMPLKPGTTLSTFCGPPFAACLLASARGLHCEHCFGELPREFGRSPALQLASTRCPLGTPGASYCSTACKDADVARHGFFEAMWRDPDEPPPTTLRLAVRCLWRRRRLGESVQDAAIAVLFDAMACEASPDASAADEDSRLGALAVKQRTGFLPEGASAANVAMMLRRLRANAFAFTDAHGGMSIGFGVYPAAATLNHSCAPNCVLTYGEGAGIRVRTTSGVKRGDELTHAYVNLAAPTRTRRAELHAKYAFTCDCSRCVHGARYVFGGEDVDELMEARRSAHAAFGGPHAACGRPHAAARGGGDGSTSTAMPGGATDVSDPSKPQTSAQDVGGAADDEAGEAIEESVVMLHKASHPSVSRAMRRKYTAAALELRRQHCHRLSLLRYQAESAMEQLALEDIEEGIGGGGGGDGGGGGGGVRAGGEDGGGALDRDSPDLVAAECGRNALAFLEMALGHVPWHPNLSLARLHLALSEVGRGERRAAHKLLVACAAALDVTHGGEHALCRQAKALESKVHAALQQQEDGCGEGTQTNARSAPPGL